MDNRAKRWIRNNASTVKKSFVSLGVHLAGALVFTGACVVSPWYAFLARPLLSTDVLLIGLFGFVLVVVTTHVVTYVWSEGKLLHPSALPPKMKLFLVGVLVSNAFISACHYLIIDYVLKG